MNDKNRTETSFVFAAGASFFFFFVFFFLLLNQFLALELKGKEVDEWSIYSRSSDGTWEKVPGSRSSMWLKWRYLIMITIINL